MDSIPDERASEFLDLLSLPDEEIKSYLIDQYRRLGIKFRSQEDFRRVGWRSSPAPRIEPFWKRHNGRVVRHNSPFIWDLREALQHETPLLLTSLMLWRRLRSHRVQFIGGVETSSIPILAGILTINRIHNGPPLRSFFLRKKRKSDGLRRILEGARPPKGAKVALVDDILNKGISKRRFVTYCKNNGLRIAVLLVGVDTKKGGHRKFQSICPIEAIFDKFDILSKSSKSVTTVRDLTVARVRTTDSRRPQNDSLRVQSGRTGKRAKILSHSQDREMSDEDIELVRLARDTVSLVAASSGQVRPMIGEDSRGSVGYYPFLGKYSTMVGPVFTRISKREFREGRWINRNRGCQCSGLMNQERWKPVAQMVIDSAVASATRARKVRPGPAVYHKCIWPEELGSLTLFLYLIEELVPTQATTARQLESEGHNPADFGLIAVSEDGFRGTICGGLQSVDSAEEQIRIVCRKMQNAREICRHGRRDVTLIRLRGRWLYDPQRPMDEFF